MNFHQRLLLCSALLTLMLVSLSVSLTALAAGPFVEPDVIRYQTFNGENIGDGFGWVGARISDLNSDGASEIIITAPFFNTAEATTTGKIYIYSGYDGRLLKTTIGTPQNLFGWSAADAGDVNFDGVSDYVIGGPGGQQGRAIVYSGKDHKVLYEFKGEAEGDQFGSGVTGAGDVNGDGFGDVLVGAIGVSTVLTESGRIYLFSGQDGSVLWQKDGQAAQNRLGGGVGRIGDVNGDGTPDQIGAAVGAGGDGRGRAYIFSGKNGDILHTLEPTGPAGTPPTFGRFFASGAGDVNGDGVPDAFVGDYNAQRGEANSTGRAYFFSGADGSALQVVEAEADGDGIGPGRGIPDINGDGKADMIVAAWTSSAGAPAGGKVYLRSGADGSLLRTVTGSIANDSLGVDALSLGDVSGDGAPDYLLTAVGLDFQGTDVGHAYIVSFKP